MDKVKEFATVKNVFIVALFFVSFLFGRCDREKNSKEIVKEYIVNTDTVIVNKIKEKIVVLKGKEVIVNKVLYKDYTKEKDTAKRTEIFIENTKVNEYNTRLVSNDSITVDVYSKTQGKLLESSANVKYKLKKEIIRERPRMSLVIGSDVGILDNKFNPRINTGLQFKNGDTFLIHSDINGNISIGYSKLITLIK